MSLNYFLALVMVAFAIGIAARVTHGHCDFEWAAGETAPCKLDVKSCAVQDEKDVCEDDKQVFYEVLNYPKDCLPSGYWVNGIWIAVPSNCKMEEVKCYRKSKCAWGGSKCVPYTKDNKNGWLNGVNRVSVPCDDPAG